MQTASEGLILSLDCLGVGTFAFLADLKGDFFAERGGRLFFSEAAAEAIQGSCVFLGVDSAWRKKKVRRHRMH